MNINVRAGENSGRSLRHDFVVTSLAHDKLGRGVREVQLPVDKPGPSAKRTALVAWITSAGDLAPIQAAGGWLPLIKPPG